MISCKWIIVTEMKEGHVNSEKKCRQKIISYIISIINSFSIDVKQMLSFNLENLKHNYKNQSTSDIAKLYMDLIKKFIKEFMRKILMMKLKKIYRKLVNCNFCSCL